MLVYKKLGFIDARDELELGNSEDQPINISNKEISKRSMKDPRRQARASRHHTWVRQMKAKEPTQTSTKEVRRWQGHQCPISHGVLFFKSNDRKFDKTI